MKDILSSPQIGPLQGGHHEIGGGAETCFRGPPLHPPRSWAGLHGEHEMPSVNRDIDEPAKLSATITDAPGESPKDTAAHL